MWPRSRLDLDWSDLLFGLRHSVAPPPDRAALEAEIEALWSPARDAIACLSVRSGFDLWLAARDFPPGSEILFTALNIKGMVKIARRRGLVPVPVDVRSDTMGPDLASLEHALSERSRALVVAPLFGSRPDLGPALEIARRHGLAVVEDRAQAFAGRGDTGHEGAEITLVSFGPLKFATALGGALARVRDPDVLARMRAIQAEYPVQSERAYRARLARFAGLKLVTTRPVLGAANAVFRLRGRDYAGTARGAARTGTGKSVRRRPSAALLALLRRRLLRFHPAQHAARRTAARTLREALGDAVPLPGIANEDHSFWVFPVAPEDPAGVMARLRAAGFDAAPFARWTALAPPDDRPKLAPDVARETLRRLLILPCYPGMPRQELLRQAAIVRGRS